MVGAFNRQPCTEQIGRQIYEAEQMQTLQSLDEDESSFQSATYLGRPIAILNRGGRWVVYLDHILQHNVMFATAENATAWLIERVDHGVTARVS